MNMQAVFILVVIGVLAGFLASWLMPKSHFGLLGDLVVGVVGSFLGSWIFGLLGAYLGGYLWALVAAFLGALLLLGILRLIASR
jgi:uncharacterized membrane protein YeaQ/YmgE (transglycosylase-associated protein family)